MKISEMMTQETVLMSPETNIRTACEIMRDSDIGFIPVTDGEKILGAVTDRDIATRGIANGMNPDETPVQDVMSRDIVFIYEDQDELEAARLMQVKQIRRLVVLNRDKRLVGILSLCDLSSHARDHALAGEILESMLDHTDRPSTHQL
ncbi:MAG TPA: CBS domain-containing protein [Oligoflexus sp.]|uniref:CBS domain-containing protein n=1 Tax=Oligoflexus sp. TaxID=1971216 RepID=UPI002D613B33|nr:CBS domain-containing protein [Oligoflexus sp.]HYX36715.1 CBS domain-containing protein [Oligoflexus sp.]